MDEQGGAGLSPRMIMLVTDARPVGRTRPVDLGLRRGVRPLGEPLHAFPAITISVCNLRPESRGSSHAASANSHAAPVIKPNYLSTLADRRVAVNSIRLARRLAGARARAL